MEHTTSNRSLTFQFAENFKVFTQERVQPPLLQGHDWRMTQRKRGFCALFSPRKKVRGAGQVSARVHAHSSSSELSAHQMARPQSSDESMPENFWRDAAGRVWMRSVARARPSLAKPSLAKTKFGQTKFGQDQVWPDQVWPRPSLARPSLAKTKFGQTKCGTIHIVRVSVKASPDTNTANVRLSFQRAFMWRSIAGRRPAMLHMNVC